MRHERELPFSGVMLVTTLGDAAADAYARKSRKIR